MTRKTIFTVFLAGIATIASAVWDELPKLPANFTKPITWRQKHYGQWCRNFTTDVHRQCPQGSFIHWYTCCGPDNTDCCFGLQTWFYIMFGGILLTVLISFIFTLLLQFDVIYPRQRKLKSGCEYNSVIQS